MLQPRRVWQSSPTRRSLYQAWGNISEMQTQILQPRWVHNLCHSRRCLSQAWGNSETQALPPRRVHKLCRSRQSLCQAWGDSEIQIALLYVFVYMITVRINEIDNRILRRHTFAPLSVRDLRQSIRWQSSGAK